MRIKIIILINFIWLLIGSSVLANDNLFQSEFLLPGKIEEIGTYFEIKDSEYLNITLESSEKIKVILESIPRMISMIVEPTSEEINSTVLKIEGLEPKTYYKMI